MAKPQEIFERVRNRPDRNFLLGVGVFALVAVLLFIVGLITLLVGIGKLNAAEDFYTKCNQTSDNNTTPEPPPALQPVPYFVNLRLANVTEAALKEDYRSVATDLKKSVSIHFLLC